MKLVNTLSALAIAASLMSGAAYAVTLEQGAKPREVPPASYRGDIYVDSRGCAYARANIGKAVNWVPRLSSGNRNEVVCGLSPTFAAGNTSSARPPAPIAPPPPAALASAAPAATTAMRPAGTQMGNMQTPSGAPAPSNLSRPNVQTAQNAPVRNAQPSMFGNLPTPSPAPAPSNLSANRMAANTTGPAVRSAPATRTLNVTCPANGDSARVQIGGSTVNVNCGGAMTQPRTYAVRHADGAMTQIIARPSAVTVAAPVAAAYGNTGAYRPATGSVRVNIGGVAPSAAAGTFGNRTTAASSQGAFAAPSGTGSFVAPRAGTSYEAYLAAKAAANSGQTAVRTQQSYAVNSGAVVVQRGAGITQAPGQDYRNSPTGSPRVIMNVPPVPEGYRPAWKDDRLNPYRGPRTVQGEVDMGQVWTNTVPRRLVEQPVVQRQTTVVTSSMSAPQRQVATQPQATSGSGYVQVGTFRDRANAQAAAGRVASLGLPGRLAQTSNGYTVVLAGPFSGSSLTNALSRARSGGFSDAFIR